MIPPPFVQELLSRVDIVDVVGRHVTLRKGGANHMGLCPFHGEKSPSFSVSPAKQFYYCFGCGASGNAIGFLTEHLGLGFVDAVQELAQQAGLSVPEDDRSPGERERSSALRAHQTSIGEVLSKAAQHYRRELRAAPQAIDYLKGRGVSGDVAGQFWLGYAPASWRSLAGIFPSYDDPLLTDSGMVIAHEAESADSADAKRYDRFRDRIMFPIRAVSGEVIGFGGRVLGHGEPKYLNSPETPVFVKGRELYGLYEARTAIRQRGYALVVEGYMDVVALAQSECRNAVATLGTACTADHLQKLFRFTDAVVFSFDGDAAGRRAAARALEAALPHASDTRSIHFLFLPPEHDPDSFVRALGIEAFERAIEAAVPLSRQLLEQARDGCDMALAEGRARFIAQARPLWAALPDGVLKGQLLRDIAATGNLDPAEVARLWQSSVSSGGRPAPGLQRDRPGPQRSLAAVPSDRRGRTRRPPQGPADHAVRILLLHSEWWERLTFDDHRLLHELPEPHGPVVGWLERQLAEHGPMSWAELEQAQASAEPALPSIAVVPVEALQDEVAFEDLRRVVDGLWIERLSARQSELIARAATDPTVLAEWREVTRRREDLLKSLAGSLDPSAAQR